MNTKADSQRIGKRKRRDGEENWKGMEGTRNVMGGIMEATGKWKTPENEAKKPNRMEQESK